MTTAPVDARFYQALPAHSLSERMAIAARDRIYEDFVRCCRPDEASTILDVGVSDALNDAANVVERKHPHKRNVTAVGLGPGDDFRLEYPEIRYVQIEPNTRLPFEDGSFDIATSNAVLEHVGSADNQQRFVSELLRVARQVFISVPNRYFPVEHHTAIPFLHYWRPSFVAACRAWNKQEWLRDENLILISKGRLKALAPAGARCAIRYTGLAMGPFSSNIYMHVAQA